MLDIEVPDEHERKDSFPISCHQVVSIFPLYNRKQRVSWSLSILEGRPGSLPMTSPTVPGVHGDDTKTKHWKPIKHINLPSDGDGLCKRHTTIHCCSHQRWNAWWLLGVLPTGWLVQSQPQNSWRYYEGGARNWSRAIRLDTHISEPRLQSMGPIGGLNNLPGAILGGVLYLDCVPLLSESTRTGLQVPSWDTSWSVPI